MHRGRPALLLLFTDTHISSSFSRTFSIMAQSTQDIQFLWYVRKMDRKCSRLFLEPTSRQVISHFQQKQFNLVNISTEKARGATIQGLRGTWECSFPLDFCTETWSSDTITQGNKLVPNFRLSVESSLCEKRCLIQPKLAHTLKLNRLYSEPLNAITPHLCFHIQTPHSNSIRQGLT